MRSSSGDWIVTYGGHEMYSMHIYKSSHSSIVIVLVMLLANSSLKVWFYITFCGSCIYLPGSYAFVYTADRPGESESIF